MKAAIDIGSNSLRLLVIGEQKGETFRQEVRETRLGEGFKEGILTDASMERTAAVLNQWQKEVRAMGIDHTEIFATSAVRDAANQKEFAALVESAAGIPLRILSGEEEAWFSFSGAVGGFDFPKENCLLIDIGGGSTEIAGYENGKLKGVSLPYGAVRWQVMQYRRSDVKRAMATELTLHHYDDVRHFIGVGGTITTAGAVMGAVQSYSREAIHGRTLDYHDLQELKYSLEAMTLEERKKVVGMPAPRADIILYGLEILGILFEVFSMSKVYISDWGILDGILAAANG